jgi:hypothetical protein
MLKIIRNWRTAPVQNLVLLITASWLLPVLLLAACAMLAGCGGGDDEDTKDIGPVDCKARPELCV